MKKVTHRAIIFLSLMTFAARMTQAQGTLYVSNLGQPTTSSAPIGSDSWLAQGIETGTDPGGYVLNSVQLQMAAGSGNPGGFTVSIYSVVNGFPSQDLANLNGSSDPSSAGIYTYTASSLMLSPSTEYSIVATAATPVVQGAYAWSGALTSGATVGLDQWLIQINVRSTDDGLEWTGGRGSASALNTAIYATAVPEPSTWLLCLLGGGFAFCVHARKRAASQVKLN